MLAMHSSKVLGAWQSMHCCGLQEGPPSACSGSDRTVHLSHWSCTATTAWSTPLMGCNGPLGAPLPPSVMAL